MFGTPGRALGTHLWRLEVVWSPQLVRAIVVLIGERTAAP